MPDEFHGMRRVASVLGLQVLRLVLADHLHPGLGKSIHVLDGDVLGGRDDGDPRADLLLEPPEALADPVRRQRRSLPGAR